MSTNYVAIVLKISICNQYSDMTFRITTLSITFMCYGKSRLFTDNVECRYAGCQYATFSGVLLSVVVLS